MKQVIFSNWNFIRFLRLGLGIVIIIQSIISRDWTMGALGILFSGMTILNIGRCGIGGCSTPVKKNTATSKDIIYEEVV